MSRVGKKPIPVPDKIKISYQNRRVTVQGPKGKLERLINSRVDLKLENGLVNVSIANNDRTSRALQGLTRSLVANMITGVERGFERVLEITGVGYRAILNGNRIEFSLGFSHPINFDLPEGISATINRNNIIILSGIDKELIGLTAASIRQLKPPETYKGKGIKYAEERVRLKAGKTGTEGQTGTK